MRYSVVYQSDLLRYIRIRGPRAKKTYLKLRPFPGCIIANGWRAASHPATIPLSPTPCTRFLNTHQARFYARHRETGSVYLMRFTLSLREASRPEEDEEVRLGLNIGGAQA